jgi:hypothetical protein
MDAAAMTDAALAQKALIETPATKARGLGCVFRPS